MTGGCFICQDAQCLTPAECWPAPPDRRPVQGGLFGEKQQDEIKVAELLTMTFPPVK